MSAGACAISGPSCHGLASVAWCQSTMFLDSWGALCLALLGTCTEGPLLVSGTLISGALNGCQQALLFAIT